MIKKILWMVLLSPMMLSDIKAAGGWCHHCAYAPPPYAAAPGAVFPSTSSHQPFFSPVSTSSSSRPSPPSPTLLVSPWERAFLVIASRWGLSTEQLAAEGIAFLEKFQRQNPNSSYPSTLKDLTPVSPPGIVGSDGTVYKFTYGG